jgi:hypothetical protein
VYHLFEERIMNEFNSSREQSALRTRIDDLPAVGEELAPEQLQLVVGGLARISGPTCCSTCSCDYADEGCGC